MWTVIFNGLLKVRKAYDSAGLFLYRHRNYFKFLIFTGSSTALTYAYLGEICDADGPSMYPTIADHEVMVGVNKLYRRGRGIQVGDCILFSSPLFPRTAYNKRVVGMPGDYVLRSQYKHPTPGDAPLCGITDWKKRLAAQQAVDEFGTYKIIPLQTQPEDEEWAEPDMIQVPEGHVWVEGDNLALSRDSRFYGPVPMALIKGRVSWWCDSYLGPFHSLRPGKGLRKVEEWEEKELIGGDER